MTLFVQQSVDGLIFGAVLSLFALGFGLVVANLGVFNAAHQGVFALTAIVAYYLIHGLGLAFGVAVVLAALAGALLNGGVYVGLVRHLERRRNFQLVAFVSCLGGASILTNSGDLALNGNTVSYPTTALPQSHLTVAGIELSSVQLIMVGASLVVVALVYWLIEKTQFGRAVRAAGYDRDTASLLGINTQVISTLVFALSGALAGVGAVLVGAAFHVVSGDMADTYVVIGLAVMVIGGFGNVAGTFVAGLLVGLVSTLTSSYVTSSYRDVVVFALLLATLMVRPQGLFTRRATFLRP